MGQSAPKVGHAWVRGCVLDLGGNKKADIIYQYNSIYIKHYNNFKFQSFFVHGSSGDFVVRVKEN